MLDKDEQEALTIIDKIISEQSPALMMFSSNGTIEVPLSLMKALHEVIAEMMKGNEVYVMPSDPQIDMKHKEML